MWQLVAAAVLGYVASGCNSFADEEEAAPKPAEPAKTKPVTKPDAGTSSFSFDPGKKAKEKIDGLQTVRGSINYSRGPDGKLRYTTKFLAADSGVKDVRKDVQKRGWVKDPK